MEVVYEQCENCNHVDRGYDDCCHETYSVTNRCPLWPVIQEFVKIYGYWPSIETVISFIGCRHFDEDLEYKAFKKEVEQMCKERENVRMEKEGEHGPEK